MVVATGFFDGVHLGHRYVLEQLVSAARERGTDSCVVTFWPHPRNVLQKDARDLRLLTSLAEKSGLIKNMGVDRVEVIPFTQEFSGLSTDRYLNEIVIERLGGTAILLGYDNRIGCDAGSPDEIAEIASSLGLEVIRADKIDEGDVAVSSTRIRSALSSGDVAAANRLLGYDYCIHGVVVAGNGLGRKLGFPTANVRLYEPLKAIPARGVYCVSVEALGRRYAGMCNIGVRPTLGDNNASTIEVNILDFSRDIYGLDVKVSFLCRLRDEIRFSSLDELAGQLGRDREATRKFVSEMNFQ